MKLPRFCAFSRCLLGVASVTALTFQASAAPFFWKSSSTSGDWDTGSNWSITNLASGTSPAAGPTSHTTGTGDIVTFTVNSPANGAQTVNLQGGEKSALGLVTTAQTTTTSILSGGTPGSILNLGESGIDHNAGGLIIGSATAAQAVDIKLTAEQTWDSSATGSGPAAIVVHNNISSTAGEYRILTLNGNNTSATINGNITNGANSDFWVDKQGTGLWTLAGPNNTFNGPLLVNGGTIRLTNRGTIVPAKIYVGGGGTLSLRAGGTGFSAAQLDEMRTAIDFGEGSDFAIDTANGNFEYDRVLHAGVSTTKRKFHLKKLGVNTLTLTGNNSTFTHRFIVSEGTLALATPAVRPLQAPTEEAKRLVSMGNGTLAPVVGGTGFTPSEVDALIAATSFEADPANNIVGSFGISTASGDVHYSAVVSLPNTIRFNKTGANTLAMTADNTYTGATTLSGGSLSVSRIPNGGIASPLGASSNAPENLVLAGGRLTYTGPALAPERLFSMGGNGGIDASGTGALTFGAGTITHSGASGRVLTLSGINQDNNTIASTVINSSGNTTSIYKTGYGNWSLTGPNTFTNFVRGRGGNVTLDYTAVDPLAGNVLIQTGTVTLKAAASGTTETMPILQLGEAHNGLGILKLTGNVNLTVTTLEGNGNSQRHNLIDLGNSGTITASKVNTTTNNLRVNPTTGLIMNSSGTEANGRANIVLRATDGTYGFAAFAPGATGATGGQLQKLSSASVLTPGANPVAISSLSTNYYLGAGSYTTTATTVNFSTLTLDSSSGPVDLAVAAGQRIGPSSTGKGILASGANDITISGGNTDNVISQPVWFHNYLDPSATLNITSNIGNVSFFIIGGTGYTNYSGLGLGHRAAVVSPPVSGTEFVQNGGVLRITTDQNLASAGGNLRVTDGIFEIGADLNGTATGDFTRLSDASFRLLGSAGFSAHTTTPGGTRVASFSNFSDIVPLVWGAADFLTNSVDNTDGDYAFCLSSPRSNATIEFKNSINLNGHLRPVEVANGSAATDAVLSGVLSGSVTSGLVKTGPGTLALTGANTYGGETRVLDGVLKIQTGSIPANSRLVIQGTGTVSVVGNVGVQSVVINGVEQAPGAVNSPLVAGNLYVGEAPAGMTYGKWVTNKALQPAESGELFDADKDGLLNLLEYGLGTEPKTPNGSPLTHNAGNSVFRFNRATDRTDISTIIESSETMTGTWSTIATSTGTGSFILNAGVTGVAIDESTPGTVIVTTSGTAPAKKFHRVRVTK